MSKRNFSCGWTGSESLTQREQLAIIGDVIGRNLVFDDLSPDTAPGGARGVAAPEIRSA